MPWGSIAVAVIIALLAMLCLFGLAWGWLASHIVERVEGEQSAALDEARSGLEAKVERVRQEMLAGLEEIRRELEAVREERETEARHVRRSCEAMLEDARREQSAMLERVRQEQETNLEQLRLRMQSRMKRLRSQVRSQARKSEDALTGLHGYSANGQLEQEDRALLVHQRRMRAADELWSAVTELERLIPLAWWMSRIDFEVASREIGEDRQSQEVFRSILGDLQWEKLNLGGAAKARPFLTPTVWATYAALEAVAFSAYWRCSTLAEGLGGTDITNGKALVKLVGSILPEEREMIEERGVEGCYRAVRSLELRLIDSLLRTLEGGAGSSAWGAWGGGDGSDVTTTADIGLETTEVMRLVDEVREPSVNTRLRDVIGAAG